MKYLSCIETSPIFVFTLLKFLSFRPYSGDRLKVESWIRMHLSGFVYLVLLLEHGAEPCCGKYQICKGF